jgi:hypothetical protein
MPHADAVVFTNDEARSYFATAENSILAKNIRSNRYASFTTDDYTTDWRKVRELQGVGRCEPATTEEDRWSVHLATQKFGATFARPPLVRGARSHPRLADHAGRRSGLTPTRSWLGQASVGSLLELAARREANWRDIPRFRPSSAILAPSASARSKSATRTW